MFICGQYHVYRCWLCITDFGIRLCVQHSVLYEFHHSLDPLFWMIQVFLLYDDSYCLKYVILVFDWLCDDIVKIYMKYSVIVWNVTLHLNRETFWRTNWIQLEYLNFMYSESWLWTVDFVDWVSLVCNLYDTELRLEL